MKSKKREEKKRRLVDDGYSDSMAESMVAQMTFTDWSSTYVDSTPASTPSFDSSPASCDVSSSVSCDVSSF